MKGDVVATSIESIASLEASLRCDTKPLKACPTIINLRKARDVFVPSSIPSFASLQFAFGQLLR